MAYGYDNRFDGRYDSNYNRQKEIQEAIHAGENALRHLYSARDELRSAGNWGLLDMFGGNFLSGMMKHSKMDQARRSMENARNALASFRSELQDVHDPALNMDIDGFLTFADFFFDGFLVDLLVQSRISKAKQQVEDAIRRGEDTLRKLRQYR